MPFPFACPHCGAETLVEDRYEGQSGPCATCGQTVRVTRPPDRLVPRPNCESPPPRSVAMMLAALGIGGVFAAVLVWLFIALVLPQLENSSQSAELLRCSSHLRQIGVALLAYHDDHGTLPPAVLLDKAGTPMHSWRVLLLPYLGEQALYDRYDFDQPWDGPDNLLLLSSMPGVYASPSDSGAVASHATSYLAVTGDGTAFPAQGPVSLAMIADGTSETGLIAESSGSSILWLEPEDLRITRMQFYIPAAAARGLRCAHAAGPHVLMADGSVKQLRPTAPSATLQALFSIAGQEAIDWSVVDMKE